MKTLTTQTELQNAKHVEGLRFLCSMCGQEKPVQTNGGTGYGYIKDKPVCYACCGEQDKQSMIETGKAMLYLSLDTSRDDVQSALKARIHPRNYGWKVTNWPGTYRADCVVHKGRHNIAGTRYDAWFTGPDSRQWHGVTYGDNTQICHCRRIAALSDPGGPITPESGSSVAPPGFAPASGSSVRSTTYKQSEEK